MNAVIDQRVCVHCGTAFRPTAHRRDYCCAGCEFVHGLIAERGLGQFYDLQESGVAPAPSTVFHQRDYTWLQELVAVSGNALTLEVQGLSCIGCAWLIERLFERRPGALHLDVDPALGRLAMRWQPGLFDVVAFARELQSFGYLVGPPGQDQPRGNRGLNLRLGLCAAFAMNTMLFTLPGYLGMEASFPFAALFSRLTFLLGTLSFFIGGSYFFIRAFQALRQRVLHIDLPIAAGLLAAYAGSIVAAAQGWHGFVYFDFVSTFTFLMLAGRWLQEKVVERNRRQLLSAQAGPITVRLATGEKISAEKIATGDLFLVEPGQLVPVRSRLESDGALLSLEWIHGESEAATVHRGHLVSAGAVNCGTAALTLLAREAWADSLLATLLRVAPTGPVRDPVFERFLRGYLWVVLGLALTGFGSWWFLTGSLLPALQVMISVLVVSCPCASGVALPLARDLAASQLRRLGVFLRDSGIWAHLSQVRKVIFDKTGTLTLESISLLNPEVLAALDERSRAVLLGLVLESLHPVSGCLREQLLAERVAPVTPDRIDESIGYGLSAEMDGHHWRLGRVAWAEGKSAADSQAPDSTAECAFSCDGHLLAEFRFGEVARDDAREEIQALQACGLEVYVLSGDRAPKVAAMAQRLGLATDHCLAELSPQQKAERVRELDAHDTLYLGDGANDSLAFDAACVSGTPAIDRGLLEKKATFYFLGRHLSGIRSLLTVGAIRRRAAHTVVAFAITYNLVAIALCFAGFMSPLLAAILMPASSLVSIAIVLLAFRGSKRSLHPAPRLTA